ncbi:GAF domain-containing protein [Frondihabitans australicus]|uniref:Response regulator receiver domain-containing protein n=1 Tax=Frondihabitans australicus TaxID=386892 RepID=A0A495ICZ2_9MICO|nr:GAF domain-containing protein [Frondihabitans australicus]RKR73884.1 response regulator receiver domain-containing protein [Frondihabitans australicus]
MPGKILVVDSDMVTRRAAMYALLPAGYEMKIAEGPFEAFGIAQKEQPDVIVLGASVLDDQGLALIGRLITAGATADTPVLAVADSIDGMDAADRAGARTVLPSPVDPQRFLDTIADLIAHPGPIEQAPEAVLADPDRLAAVEALKPGPDGEPSLDRFTALASKMLNAPVSIITLIDMKSQTFASQHGRDPDGTKPTAVPLTHSFCQFAVTSRQPLRIDETRTHPLVQNSPAIDEDDIEAYLGVPLIVGGQHAVGALCVTEHEPRQWTDEEEEMLSDLAEILTTELDTAVKRGRHASV